jgi:enoyl-CoA hydratase/carnithine racemase
VTLSNPAKFNAMSRAMWRELRQVFTELQQRTDLRAVLVAGEGGHFCAGGDIAEYTDFAFSPSPARLPRERRLGRALGHARLRPAHRRADRGQLHGGRRGDRQLLRHPHGRAGRAFRCADCQARFPMAPREAELVAREAGLATARQMLLEAAVLDAPTMLARGFLQTVLPDATCRRGLATRRAHHAPGAAGGAFEQAGACVPWRAIKGARRFVAHRLRLRRQRRAPGGHRGLSGQTPTEFLNVFLPFHP